MQTAREGNTVRVHYTGSFEDGTVFDSSEGNEPLELTLGAGQVISGFEQALVGMSAGEKKRESIGADRAYGPRRDELIFTVARSDVPDGMEVEVGDVLRVGFGDGQTAPMQVAAIDDATVTLDANHPLAGKTLIFDLEIVSIE